jgi:hypothetical protein
LIKSGPAFDRAASPTPSKLLSKSPTSSLKRLDEQEMVEDLKANREKKPIPKRFFPEGKDSPEAFFSGLPLEPLQKHRSARHICGGQRARHALAPHSGRQWHDLLQAHGGCPLHHSHARAAVHLRGYRLSSVNALSLVDFPQFLWPTTSNALPFNMFEFS